MAFHQVRGCDEYHSDYHGEELIGCVHKDNRPGYEDARSKAEDISGEYQRVEIWKRNGFRNWEKVDEVA